VDVPWSDWSTGEGEPDHSRWFDGAHSLSQATAYPRTLQLESGGRERRVEVGVGDVRHALE
jgi:hypothetical protein